MHNTEEIRQIEELLLALLPVWYQRLEKPVKQALENGISLEMYYCLQTLRAFDGTLTMTELARWLKIPKQQMTKLAARLTELQLAERVDDPADRRIIRLRITEQGLSYINTFLDHDAAFFKNMLEEMNATDLRALKQAADTLLRIFTQ